MLSHRLVLLMLEETPACWTFLGLLKERKSEELAVLERDPEHSAQRAKLAPDGRVLSALGTPLGHISVHLRLSNAGDATPGEEAVQVLYPAGELLEIPRARRLVMLAKILSS